MGLASAHKQGGIFGYLRIAAHSVMESYYYWIGRVGYIRCSVVAAPNSIENCRGCWAAAKDGRHSFCLLGHVDMEIKYESGALGAQWPSS